ncbi:hypothetical protein FB451DRAFT_1567154 [Mycena latifolia]|nr:hypothetical protein FB451DRAFT_1567154 [Mycena latifolia]
MHLPAALLLPALAFALGASAVPSTGPASASASAAASSSSAIGTPTNSTASPRVVRAHFSRVCTQADVRSGELPGPRRGRVFTAPLVCSLPSPATSPLSLLSARRQAPTPARYTSRPCSSSSPLPAPLPGARHPCRVLVIHARRRKRKRKWKQQRSRHAGPLGGAALRERASTSPPPLFPFNPLRKSSAAALLSCLIACPAELPSAQALVEQFCNAATKPTFIFISFPTSCRIVELRVCFLRLCVRVQFEFERGVKHRDGTRDLLHATYQRRARAVHPLGSVPLTIAGVLLLGALLL